MLLSCLMLASETSDLLHPRQQNNSESEVGNPSTKSLKTIYRYKWYKAFIHSLPIICDRSELLFFFFRRLTGDIPLSPRGTLAFLTQPPEVGLEDHQKLACCSVGFDWYSLHFSFFISLICYNKKFFTEVLVDFNWNMRRWTCHL